MFDRLFGRRVELWQDINHQSNCIWYYNTYCKKNDIEQSLVSSVNKLTSLAGLNTEQCSTASQYNFLRTGVILVYLSRMNWGDSLKVTVIQLTTNKSIAKRKKIPVMSKVTRVAQNNFCRHSKYVSTRKKQLNHMSRFLTDSIGHRGLPKISIGKRDFNLSLCLFEPKNINSLLSGFNLNLLVSILSFAPSKHLFNCSRTADLFWDMCIYKLGLFST